MPERGGGGVLGGGVIGGGGGGVKGGGGGPIYFYEVCVEGESDFRVRSVSLTAICGGEKKERGPRHGRAFYVKDRKKSHEGLHYSCGLMGTEKREKKVSRKRLSRAK